jgi:hypothetical protein
MEEAKRKTEDGDGRLDFRNGGQQKHGEAREKLPGSTTPLSFH